MNPARYIASFDSASAFLRALGSFLHGRDFPALGVAPRAIPQSGLAAAGVLLNRIPERWREQLYTWSGWAEAIPARRASEIDAEAMARWVVSHYPARSYQAIMLGSSNGAAVHLCAALGIPWLPQTFLVPLRQSTHPDEPLEGMAMARGPARVLLRANPELELHHMHDPVQDRLMIQRMTYFRVKRLRLGVAYRDYIERCLEPNGTILVLDCRLRWPTTRIADRHFFQHGAFGGVEPDELLHGSERIASYLARYGSHRRRWEPPEPDGERPEAEWGFAPTLIEDLEEFAAERGYRLRRIVIAEPEDLSPFVADLCRWWYRRNGLPTDRLLAESFILIEPRWAWQSPAAPFWAVFNTEPSADRLERYLDGGPDWDEIVMMLFSHGVESAGLASIERWRGLMGRATSRAVLAGTDPERYPRDFGVFARYHRALEDLPSNDGGPPQLPLSELDEFVAHRFDASVRWS